MSVLYAMRYAGETGAGIAAVCIGHGTIVGFDGANSRYEGTYQDVGDRFLGTATLTINGAWPLVIGTKTTGGEKFEFSVDWPADFANGQPLQIFLAGRPVTVTFEKIGEIP